MGMRLQVRYCAARGLSTPPQICLPIHILSRLAFSSVHLKLSPHADSGYLLQKSLTIGKLQASLSKSRSPRKGKTHVTKVTSLQTPWVM